MHDTSEIARSVGLAGAFMALHAGQRLWSRTRHPHNHTQVALLLEQRHTAIYSRAQFGNIKSELMHNRLGGTALT